MKKAIIFLSFAGILVSCTESLNSISKRVFELAAVQCTVMDSQLTDSTSARTYTCQGDFVPSKLNWWCSGFFPGTLWYVYEWTGDEKIRVLAEKNTLKLADVKACGSAHDLGFQYWCSYGNALRITGDEKYKPAIFLASENLAARFNPTVGCIRSWGKIDDMNSYLVIIDNMMNLELLTEAAKMFSRSSLKDIAVTHANTTLANHFRPDGSSYHVVEYNPSNGEVIKKRTAQGYADESRWSRGQSWGLYGFTMMYRETGINAYLEQAQAIADALIPALPEDGIPYWDYDSPAIPDTYRDASAAAVMCSALIELSTQTCDKRASKYLKTAERQIRTLASEEYLAKPGTNGGFLLKHSTGDLNPKGKMSILETNAPLTYADYYFLEALLRYQHLFL